MSTVPTQKTVQAVQAALAACTLASVQAAAADAAAAIGRLQGAGAGLKASVTTAVLRVIAKETPVAVAATLAGLCAGAKTPNLATVRAAAVKMAAAYGSEAALPVWGSVAEASASGDAALAALAARQDVAGAGAALAAAAGDFGMSPAGAGKLLAQLAELRQQLGEASEEASEEAAQARAARAAEEAELAAELETLRAIFGEARRLFAMPEASPSEVLAEMANTDAA